MLTIKQLLRYTFTVAKKNSAQVEFSNIRRGYNKAGQPKYLVTAHSVKPNVRAHEAARYKCSCTALDKKKLFAGPVKVSCACDFFMYYCEYALHKQGAADILYSNGEPPVERNPKLQPSLCKHLYAMLTDIQDKRI